MKYPFVRPEMPAPEDWAPHLIASYQQRQYTNFGPTEQSLASRLRDKYLDADKACVLCSNATIGLTAALMALGARGRVVVPSFTFPATLHAVLNAGCEPVLADVDPESWELSPAAVERILNDDDGIVALMPVRAFGFVRDLSALRAIASERGLPIVVDAAAALGNLPLGDDRLVAPREIEVFSLHATKSFGIGEGGALFAGRDFEAPLKRALNFGLGADRRFGSGLNGKMSEFQAAVGHPVLEKMDAVVARRRHMYGFYCDLVARIGGGIETARAIGPASYTNFPALFPPGADCAAIAESAGAAGVQLRRYYFPSLAEGYTGEVLNPFGTPVADDLSKRMICFPLYSNAAPEELDEIGAVIAKAVADAL